MELENITQYDKRALLALNVAASRTVQRRGFLLRRIFLFTVGGLCLISGAILAVLFRDLDGVERILCVGSLLLGALAVAEGVFQRRLGARASRRFLVKGTIERRFFFTEESFRAEILGVEQSVYSYSALIGVCEIGDYFVLQLDKRYGIIVDKRGFTQGDPDEFRRLLSQKTGNPIRFIKW